MPVIQLLSVPAPPIATQAGICAASTPCVAVATFALFALSFTPTARADQSFCVDDFAGLKTALASWTTAPDGSTVTIDLVQGSYDFDGADNTLDLQQPLHAASLKLLGGYTPGCSEDTRVLDARNTVIDGHEEPTSRFELAEVDGNALFEGITFTGLVYGVQIVHMLAAPSGGHSFVIDHSRIERNINQSGEPAYAVRLWGFGNNGGSGADVAIRNSLIADNDDRGVGPFGILSTGSGGSITLANSTIANNLADAGFALQSVEGIAGVDFEVIDDIAWHNGSNGNWHDLDVSSASTPPAITYTSAGVIVGAIEPTATNSTDNPRFLDGSDGNYRLDAGSPALDSGAPSQPGGFPALDLDGNPRVQGDAIDRGAYEALPGDLIFFDGFSAQ